MNPATSFIFCLLQGSFTVGRDSVIIGIDKSTSMEMTDIPDNSFILGKLCIRVTS